MRLRFESIQHDRRWFIARQSIFRFLTALFGEVCVALYLRHKINKWFDSFFEWNHWHLRKAVDRRDHSLRHRSQVRKAESRVFLGNARSHLKVQNSIECTQNDPFILRDEIVWNDLAPELRQLLSSIFVKAKKVMNSCRRSSSELKTLSLNECGPLCSRWDWK